MQFEIVSSMARQPRFTPAGYVYHAVNRGLDRMELFADDTDYSTFFDLLGAAQSKVSMRICAVCVMPNHWHLALWPEKDGTISKFLQRLTSDHVSAWRKRWGGSGHLYQGRFRSFPVQTDGYYQSLVRYIERNPVRAKLVDSAIEWKWSSTVLRFNGAAETRFALDPGPIRLESNWLEELERSDDQATLKQLRLCQQKSKPYGDRRWAEVEILQYQNRK